MLFLLKTWFLVNVIKIKVTVRDNSSGSKELYIWTIIRIKQLVVNLLKFKVPLLPSFSFVNFISFILIKNHLKRVKWLSTVYNLPVYFKELINLLSTKQNGEMATEVFSDWTIDDNSTSQHYIFSPNLNQSNLSLVLHVLTTHAEQSTDSVECKLYLSDCL